MQFVYAGDYICWTQGLDTVQVLNLEKSAIRKEIQLQAFVEHAKKKSFWPQRLRIDACNPQSLIQAGWITLVDPTNFHQLENHIQLTVHHRAVILNLEAPKPVVLDQIDKMEMLYDAQHYIETGFKLYYWGEDGSDTYKNPRNVSPSPRRNLIFETNGDRITGIFRKFTSHDIEIAKRFLLNDSPKIENSNIWS